jgi:hypothetical protein
MYCRQLSSREQLHCDLSCTPPGPLGFPAIEVDAQPTTYPRPVGRDVQPSACGAGHFGLLVDIDRCEDAGLAQRQTRHQPAHSGTNDDCSRDAIIAWALGAIRRAVRVFRRPLRGSARRVVSPLPQSSQRHRTRAESLPASRCVRRRSELHWRRRRKAHDS